MGQLGKGLLVWGGLSNLGRSCIIGHPIRIWAVDWKAGHYSSKIFPLQEGSSAYWQYRSLEGREVDDSR